MKDGLLTHFKQVCVPGIGGLRNEIMSEAHHSMCTIDRCQILYIGPPFTYVC
jgi:hypothetical protein